MRDMINYAIGKLRDDWKIDIQGFSLSMGKVLTTTEILKSKVPFLF